MIGKISTRVVISNDEDTIILKQLISGDARKYFNLINYDRSHLSQFGDTTANKYPTEGSVLNSIINPKNPNKLRFGIWDHLIMVGSCNITPIDSYCAEVGDWIGKQFIGNHYSARCLKILSSFVFDKLKYKTLVAKIAVGNEASRKSVEAAGYKYIKSEGQDMIYKLTQHRKSSQRIYFYEKFIGYKKTIDIEAKKVIATYQKQFDTTLRPLIIGYPTNYILPSTICADEVIYESPSSYPCTIVGKNKQYYFNTTKNHIYIKQNYEKIIHKLKNVSSIVYGGLQPCVRYENSKMEGWRARVFPQGDFEIISQPISQQEQIVIESNILVALIKSLRLHGFKDNQIVIRINNKEAIIYQLWRDVGLTDVINDKFLQGLNELEKTVLSGGDVVKHQKMEMIFWDKIKGNFNEIQQQIIFKILVENKYNLSLFKKYYPKIASEITRMDEIISLVKKSVGNEVSICVAPRSVKPGNYRGITIQADLKIGNKYYPEVCGGGCDFFYNPDYYVGGFALGLMRLKSLQKLL